MKDDAWTRWLKAKAKWFGDDNFCAIDIPSIDQIETYPDVEFSILRIVNNGVHLAIVFKNYKRPYYIICNKNIIKTQHYKKMLKNAVDTSKKLSLEDAMLCLLELANAGNYGCHELMIGGSVFIDEDDTIEKVTIEVDLLDF